MSETCDVGRRSWNRCQALHLCSCATVKDIDAAAATHDDHVLIQGVEPRKCEIWIGIRNAEVTLATRGACIGNPFSTDVCLFDLCQTDAAIDGTAQQETVVS